MSLTKGSSRKLNKKFIRQIVNNALKEDKARQDVTTLAFVPASVRTEGKIFAKQNGVVAGVDIAKEVFKSVDKGIQATILKKDGSIVKRGAVVMKLKGKARSILSAERVALNFLQHLSGIATVTFEYVQKLKGTSAKLLDTRKTIPGLRLLEKYAVKMGGGENHRMDLSDLALIKDNHLALSDGGLVQKIKKLRRSKKIKIEVEAMSLGQVKKFIKLNIDLVLLDNMSIAHMKKAVKLIRRQKRKIFIEASGNVNLKTIKGIARTGVDYISVGKVTHSAQALDLSLLLKGTK